LLNEKVIIFLPYLDAIDALSEEIGSRFAGERVFSVDGRSTADDRFQTVENFQTISGFAVLLANPRAAGQGLNIARANHVIHYSPDWNPAQQDQATFRVLRPGQDKEVFVHRFIYAETIEEAMDEALSEKRDTAEAVLSSSESEGSSKSLEKALSLSPRRNS
jgi:SNF2 family DNA or RNA helicase